MLSYAKLCYARTVLGWIRVPCVHVILLQVLAWIGTILRQKSHSDQRIC